ncbi:hypothetical protein THAOC_20113, partial [Thalassiosira oceanica]
PTAHGAFERVRFPPRRADGDDDGASHVSAVSRVPPGRPPASPVPSGSRRVARDGRGVRGGERRERERGGGGHRRSARPSASRQTSWTIRHEQEGRRDRRRGQGELPGLGCAPRALAAQRRFGSGDNFELVEVDGDGLGDDGPSRSSSSGPWRSRPAENRSRGAPYPLEIAAGLAKKPSRGSKDDGGLALAASAAAVISPGKTRAAAGEDDIRPSSTGLAPAASPPAVAVAPRRPGLVPLERLSSWPPAASNLGPVLPVLRAAPTSGSSRIRSAG